VDFVGKSSNSKEGKEAQEDGMSNAEGVESNSYVIMNLT